MVAARLVDEAQRRACRLLANANHILSRLRSVAGALSDIFTANLFTANLQHRSWKYRRRDARGRSAWPRTWSVS